MNSTTKKLVVAASLALATTGLAWADDGGGDNSMSQWTGESYAAFNGGNRGEAAYARAERHSKGEKVAKTDAGAKRDEKPADKRERPLSLLSLPTNPFSDYTA